MKPGEAARQAVELVEGERHDEYGDAGLEFKRVSRMFAELTGITISPLNVALFMVCLKLVRESNNNKLDNIVDAIGYLSLMAQIKEEDP